jgi:hypothetical protein
MLTRSRTARLLRLAAAASAVAFAAPGMACAQTAEPAAATQPLPEWFRVERADAIEEGFPDLADIPGQPSAQTDAAFWAQLRADVAAGRAQLQASPRSAPPPADADPLGFSERAREGINDTARRY